MDRLQLKTMAKHGILTSRPGPWLATIILMAISTAASFVIGQDTMSALTNAALTGDFSLFSPVLSKLPFLALALFVYDVFVYIISVGYSKLCLYISRGQPVSTLMIFDGFTMAFKILGLYLVSSILIFLQLMLFIIPGIIAAFAYSQAIYIILDDPSVGIFEALRRSRAMMRGRKIDYFILQLSFILWSFGIAFTFGLLSIWVTPYMETTMACFYNDISGYAPAPAQPEEDNFWEGM